MGKKALEETIELIRFRISEVLDTVDYDKTYPTYQDMLRALNDIRSITK